MQINGEVRKGHSYQAVTGKVPSAADRMRPTLADLAKRRHDNFDKVSLNTENETVF